MEFHLHFVKAAMHFVTFRIWMKPVPLLSPVHAGAGGLTHAMAIALAVPPLTIGLVAGADVDRADRRRIMLVSDLLGATTVLGNGGGNRVGGLTWRSGSSSVTPASAERRPQRWTADRGQREPHPARCVHRRPPGRLTTGRKEARMSQIQMLDGDLFRAASTFALFLALVLTAIGVIAHAAFA
jgi:hypothetical protein